MGWFAPFYFLHVFTCKKKKDRSHIFKYGAGTLGEGGGRLGGIRRKKDIQMFEK